MKTETLREKQSRFAKEIPRLIDKAYALGYEVTLGDAYRDPRVFGALGVRIGYGHPKSAHKNRLAIDLNLFKDGIFMASSEAHRALGEYWKSQGFDHCWGGDFSIPDGNHYSILHQGVR